MARTAIVEDEPALRDNYSAALARHGYQVKTYGNRSPAMQTLVVHLPDLAIIDLTLEDEPEGGFDLCRGLRALSAELPIIFLTARDSELDAVSGLGAKMQTTWNGAAETLSLTEFWIVHALARNPGPVPRPS